MVLPIGTKIYETDGVRIYESQITSTEKHPDNGEMLYNTSTGQQFSIAAVMEGPLFISKQAAEVRRDYWGTPKGKEIAELRRRFSTQLLTYELLISALAQEC